jgi:very-short-patch-repair endonuclease/predicted transcriptional regulator of viral defense system
MDTRALEARLAEVWPDGDVCTAAQLRMAGIGDRQLAAAVAAGLLVRVRRGAYAVASTWRTLAPWERQPRRLEAHIRTVSGAVYSHSSAAILHGARVWDAGENVHVTTSYRNGQRNHGIDVTSHCHPLPETAVVAVDSSWGSVLATSPARTAVDCARTLPLEKGLVIMDSLLAASVSKEDIAAELAAATTTRESAVARRVLALANGRSESVGETRLRLVMTLLGIPEPVLQFWLKTSEGNHRVDFAWPEAMLIVEFDGEGKYTEQGTPHKAVLAERRREAALMERGWRFIRIRWSDLGQPEEIRRRIMSKLAGYEVPAYRTAA